MLQWKTTPPKNIWEAQIGLEGFEKEKKGGHTARWIGKEGILGNNLCGGFEYDQSMFYETLNELIKYLKREYLLRNHYLKHTRTLETQGYTKELHNERTCQSV